jgi:hypothetical protein
VYEDCAVLLHEEVNWVPHLRIDISLWIGVNSSLAIRRALVWIELCAIGGFDEDATVWIVHSKCQCEAGIWPLGERNLSGIRIRYGGGRVGSDVLRATCEAHAEFDGCNLQAHSAAATCESVCGRVKIDCAVEGSEGK